MTALHVTSPRVWVVGAGPPLSERLCTAEVARTVTIDWMMDTTGRGSERERNLHLRLTHEMPASQSMYGIACDAVGPRLARNATRFTPNGRQWGGGSVLPQHLGTRNDTLWYFVLANTTQGSHNTSRCGCGTVWTARGK